MAFAHVATCIVSALDPPRDGHAPRKGGVHGKKAIKQGAGSNPPEVDTPFPIDDGSDSGDEYHDALPGEWWAW